jgi:hypothetical protein
MQVNCRLLSPNLGLTVTLNSCIDRVVARRDLDVAACHFQERQKRNKGVWRVPDLRAYYTTMTDL